MIHQQARLIDLDARVGDPLHDDALLGERLAERDALLDALDHRLERALRQTDRAHAMVDAPRPKPALRDLEAAAFAEQQVLGRDAHVLEDDLGVTVRRVIVAEHAERAQDGDPGRVDRHDRIDCCRCLGALGFERPRKISTLQRGWPAPRVHHLRPLMHVASPSRTISALMFVASDDATPGSVIEKPERISAASSGLQPAFLVRVAAVAREHFHVARVGRASN